MMYLTKFGMKKFYLTNSAEEDLIQGLVKFHRVMAIVCEQQIKVPEAKLALTKDSHIF